MSTADLLDRVLACASDVDHALLLASELGWGVYCAEGPARTGGQHWLMLRGPAGEYVTAQAMPEIVTGPCYANAGHQSFYGALVLALLRGVLAAKQRPEDVAEYRRMDRGKGKRK